ncbi:peroxisomal ATPase PEX6-like [Lytechinus pictus]|uniref:peroxisomal ATPase PEX6-like n=1 Tax=Lytechinus pictus TaxID=7653 RepID=UPI0030B9E8EA
MAAFMSFPVTRTHAKFSRFNFPVDHNALHLGISKSASSRFLGDKLDNYGYAIVSLVTEHESSTAEDRELFVCLQILDDAVVKKSISLSQVSECPDTVTVYATEMFHKHYKILDHEDVYIRPVKSFPLAKAVFGARTSRCYEWSKKRLFSTGLLVSACQQKVLVRANDRFLAPVIPVFSGDETYSLANYMDLIALECEPVTQGIISVNTSIVITDISSSIGFPDETHISPRPNRIDRKDGSEDGMESPCFELPEPRIMSDFAQGLLEIEDHHTVQNQHSDSGTADDMSLSSGTTINMNGEHRTASSLLLRPVLMPTSSAHRNTFGKGNRSISSSFIGDQCELAYKLGVTKDTLDKLHAYNGSWVTVTLAEHPSETEDETVRADLINTDVELDEAAVSILVPRPGNLDHIQISTPKNLPVKSVSSKPPMSDQTASDSQNDVIDSKEDKRNEQKDEKTLDQPLLPSQEGQQKRAHLAQIFVVNPKLFPNGDKRGRRSGAHVPFNSNEVEFIVENDSVAISPQLWFNIQDHPSQLIQPDTMVSVKLATDELEEYSSILATSQSITTSCKPPIATAVHLSLIKSPHYPMTSQFDDAIKKYFSVTRLLSKGDVISFSTRAFPEFTQEAGEGGGQRLPNINFLVNKIVSPVERASSYLVNVLHTTVYQEGPKPSFIPVTSDVYLSNKLDPLWASPVPTGISKYPFQLEQLILPFLFGRVQCERLPSSILLTGPAGSGKATAVKAVCRQLNMHCINVNCYDLLADTSAATEAKVRNTFFKAGMSVPCIILLRNIHAIGRDREGSGDDLRVAAYLKETINNLHSTYPDWPMIVVATAPSAKRVTADIQSCFLHHLGMEVPNEQERCDILQALCEKVSLAADVEIPHIAKRTAGMVLGDLAALHAHTIRAALSRIVAACSVGSKLSIQEEKDICAAGVQIHQSDFEVALSKLQSAHADSIGAPKIPNVSWEDVGGLSDVKAEILDTIQLPLQHPELFAAGLRRSGVLLYGPPGTGKTLLAKAVATECSLNFLSVKGPELINMYVGQSEENVREVFIRARSASPCVIFFDELDSLAPNRGRSGDSGGVMDRVVSQLLAELDGLHKSADVFVIGATNRPDLLDPALLRPGRFDKLLYLGVSEDRSSQSRILHALTRKFNLSPSLDLDVIAEQCPLTLTGADFYALCSDAMLGAIKRKIASLEAGETTDQSSIVVEENDFLQALDRLVPSISELELNHYKQIQNRISRGL